MISILELERLQPRVARTAPARPRVAVPLPPDQAEIFYRAVLARWADTFGRMVLEETGAGPTRQDALGDWLEKMANLRARAAALSDAQSLGGNLLDVAGRVIRHATYETARVLGIPTPGNDLAVQRATFLRTNVQLIQNLTQEQLDQVERVLKAGGSAEQIQALVNVTANRARLIATDQTLKLNAQVERVRLEAAGVQKYAWTTLEDGDVRPTHAALHDTVQTWASPPVVNRQGRRAHPGEDIACRCRARPVL